jgi:hypothetical protein
MLATPMPHRCPARLRFHSKGFLQSAERINFFQLATEVLEKFSG